MRSIKMISPLYPVLLSIHLLLPYAASQSGSSFNRFEPVDSLIESALTNRSSNSAGDTLVWQPLRATFRPLNRPSPPPIPSPPPVPTPPTPPAPPPVPLALVSAESPPEETRFARADNGGGSPPTTTTTPLALTPDLDDEDQPTRAPMNRFRPTRPPSVDPQSQPNLPPFGATSGSQNATNPPGAYRITNECFECICEASTSCNPNSRCQTSDVRHTRCGLFLISYDQWLETGLSKQLVTREALARDAAADERAFYECVTERSCAERLLAVYMQKNAKDCDKDGRIDCYDVAAIHQGGTDRCQNEALLESQYWSDFNACFGFGR